MRRLFALLILIAVALPASAQDRPRAGLMWNRSGLPATLPLVVKTMPGHDYVVFLTPTKGGDAVMAGYIHGGALFRLLVPPGTWRIRFAHGREWHGPESLFGPLTDWTEMAQPMTFGAGIARKQGHIIRLIEQDGRMQIVSADPHDLCQTVDLTSQVVTLDEESRDLLRMPTPALRRLDVQADIRSRLCL